MRILYCVSAYLMIATMAQPATAAPPAANPVLRSAASAARPTPEAALAFVKAYSPSDIRRAAEISLLRREFVPGLKRDADVAEMLETFPKLGDALTKAMESQIDVFITEYDE